jgi:putative transposase
MSNYRRAHISGGIFFFTVVTERRARILCQPAARTALGEAFRECKRRWPFQIDAMVLLPDHLHAIWTLPPGDTAYSKRWGWIKKEFSKSWLATGGIEQPLSESQYRHRRRGVWQHRFWEHTVRDEGDYARHFDYVHWNPVKHDLVESVAAWPFSTFHRWVRKGVYARTWGSRDEEKPDFSDMDSTAMG